MSKARDRRRDNRKRQQRAAYKASLALLDQLRDDQCERVRQILRSWTGIAMTEANVHLPECRRAIRHVLNHHP